MPTDFDPSGDLAQVADGLEAVVVTRVAGSLSCSVSGALRTRITTDQPVPSDYDGTGGCDPGIYRPSSGLWGIRGITRVYFGASGDIPVTR